MDPWSRKIPHTTGHLSLCATAMEAQAPRAGAPQQEKPLCWEARTPQRKVAPASHNWRKPVSEVKSLSRVRLFATAGAVAYQASLSMGFSRQEYRSGLPFPSPGDLPDPGIELGCPALRVDTLPSESPGKIRESLWAATKTQHSPQNKMK